MWAILCATLTVWQLRRLQVGLKPAGYGASANVRANSFKTFGKPATFPR